MSKFADIEIPDGRDITSWPIYRDVVDADVLINVPIRNTEQMIRDIGPLMDKGQLLVDNTSIKTQPVAAMLQATGPGVEVLGMHTVFGPNAASLHGQNVVFTGSGTQPGVGVPMVLVSGRLAAERVLGPDPTYRSRAWR